MGRIAKQRHGKFGGGRIELNQKEIQEQVDVIIQAFLAFPVLGLLALAPGSASATRLRLLLARW